MLSAAEGLPHFLIWRSCVCSDAMSSESLVTHEERSTRLFLAPTTCHVGSSASRLLVAAETFIELDGFVELKEFREKEEGKRLYFGASGYLAGLFRKISSAND